MGMYKALFLAGLIVALVCLLLSVVLFFVFKIPKALGVVTGSAERKAIAEIRASGYESKSKKEAIHASQDKIHVRDAEMDTGALKKDKSDTLRTEPEKDVSKDSARTRNRRNGGRRPGKDVALENEETEVLGQDSPTVVSSISSEKGWTEDADETDVLSGASGGTVGGTVGRGGYEDATDVLSGAAGATVGGTVGRGGYEDATDVLSGTAGAAAGRGGYEEETDVLSGSGSKASRAAYEEETDVLSSGKQSGPVAAGEEETDVLMANRRTETVGRSAGTAVDDEATDVLISGRNEVPEDEEIVGRYSGEETAVLRSIHTRTDEDAGKGIRVIAKITIVHSNESLY